jgi:hypothetical protein
MLFRPGDAAAHPPYGMPVDRGGNVYFSDLEAVWKLAPDGRLSLFRPAVPARHVHELAITPDGAVEGDQNSYDPATERFYSGLWRRTMDGRETEPVPLTETAPAGFGVWQDRSGNRYASHWPSNQDQRTMLTRRRPDGRSELLFSVGKPTRRSHSSVGSVGPMAFPADGSVLFADGPLLRRLASNGTVSLVYRGGRGSSLRSLALAGDGRVLAADMGARTVIAIGSDGRAETLFTERENWLPTGVATALGRLFVLEANGDHHDYVNRVRVVEVRNGASRVVAAPGAKAAAPTLRPAQSRAGEAGGTNGRATAAAAAVAAALAAGAAMLGMRRRRKSA